MPDHRTPFDAASYQRRTAAGCFICRMLAGDPGYEHEIVHRDAEHVVFLNRYPTVLGQLLVAPLRHLEHLARDLDEEAFVRLARLVHRSAVALEAVVPSERTYVASLGSQQANAHLHVHVAALPPGVPPEQQQLAALDAGRRGVIAVSEARTAEIASRIKAHLGS